MYSLWFCCYKNIFKGPENFLFTLKFWNHWIINDLKMICFWVTQVTLYYQIFFIFFCWTCYIYMIDNHDIFVWNILLYDYGGFWRKLVLSIIEDLGFLYGSRRLYQYYKDDFRFQLWFISSFNTAEINQKIETKISCKFKKKLLFNYS